jgi:hypothetical protein
MIIPKIYSCGVSGSTGSAVGSSAAGAAGSSVAAGWAQAVNTRINAALSRKKDRIFLRIVYSSRIKEFERVHHVNNPKKHYTFLFHTSFHYFESPIFFIARFYHAWVIK